MKARVDMTLIKHGWPFDEKSTRNCIHCKVYSQNHRKKACCEYNYLSEKVFTDKNPDYGNIYKYGLTLQTVVRCPAWASSACRDCPLFEHDIPLNGQDDELGQSPEEAKREFYRDYMRERRQGAKGG